jgi:subtilisin family serine protease
MDVKKPLMALAIFVSLSACQKTKSLSDVAEGNNTPLSKTGCLGQKLDNKFLVQWEDGRIDSMTWERGYDSFIKEFVEPNLENLKRVEFDRLIQLSQPVTPDLNGAYSQDWGQKNIQADLAWSAGADGHGILVGVVDTWVDASHPQLKNQFQVNAGEIPENGIDDDNNGFVDDYYGARFFSDPAPPAGEKTPVIEHGTHVSGIIAADPSQGAIKGIAYKAKIIQASFLNSYGSGSFSDAVKALDYVKNRGVKVINASWGGIGCSSIVGDKMAELGAAGILMVVAAGNDHVDIGSVLESPSSFNLFNQITVAANTPFDFLTTFSNFSTRLVHLTAPGEGIISTVPYGYDPTGLASLSGTSMAAPFVTGAAALVWSVRPNATMVQVKAALLNSVDVFSNYPLITQGRLNVKKAVDEIKRLNP